MEVMTVRGPIPADELGITLPHEHLFLDLFRVSRVPDDKLDDEPLIVEEVRRFAESGGRTIVELTNHGLGRDPAGLQRVSEATGINVVMGSGWYREPYYDHQYIAQRSTRDLAADFVMEIEQGEPEGGIRPGVIGEIGADRYYVSPAEERVFRASARAHLKTGLTITTHAVGSPVGLQQLDILEDEDVELRRVIVGHAATYPRPDYHEAIARRGAYVQFDTLRGLQPYKTEQQIRLVLEVARRGYLEQLLLSHDCCVPGHLVAYGGTGYAYILSSFIPRLKEAGLSAEQIQMLLVENPRRALTGER